MVDVDALIAGAKLAQRSVPICLRADIMSDLQDLERQLRDAEQERIAAGSLAAGSASRALADQIEALRVEMAEHTMTLKVRAVPRRRWTALLAEHPPREGNPRDKALELNSDTFFDAAVRECTFEPELTTAQWDKLDPVISDAQWQLLCNAVWAVNASDTDVPFSLMASRVMNDSASE